jgi:hypothetical protein
LKKWLRRIRGAVGMGLTWAVGWGLGGLLIGVASIQSRAARVTPNVRNAMASLVVYMS